MTLKERRKAAGMTQQEVANVLGVDQSAVAYWERGKYKPRKKRLAALAKLYGCSEEELSE